MKWGELGENTTARGLQYLRKFDTKSSSSVRDGPENTGFRNQTDQDRITWRDKPVASLEKISSKLVTEMEKTSFGNQTDQLEVRWREKHPKTPQPIEEPDKTSFESQTDRFAIHPPFSLPTPRATLPLSELLACPWVGQLKSLLPLLPPSLPISLVSSDHTYREVLLNWLIAAEVKVHPPLSSVLVLSLDVSLHQLLGERGVACVHIPPSCLLAHSLRLQHHVTFSQVRHSQTPREHLWSPKPILVACIPILVAFIPLRSLLVAPSTILVTPVPILVAPYFSLYHQTLAS